MRKATIYSTITILGTLLLKPCVSMAGREKRPDRAPGQIANRADGEHVVLANCITNKDLTRKSSEAAYFASSPSGTPDSDDISIVANASYAAWTDGTFHAKFDTGVIFSATLAPETTEGDYAGAGNNGYGIFSCWQRTQENLYSHANKDCSMVYDCDHSPSPTPTPSAANTTVTQKASSSDNLSVGAIVGISVGTAFGGLAIASLAGFFLWRHLRSGKRKPVELDAAEARQGHGGNGATGRRRWRQQQQQRAGDAVKVDEPVHELDGHQAQINEIYGHGVRGELDGVPRGELDAYEWAELASPMRFSFSPGVIPATAYGEQKGPV
ncbi:hypothetical protein F4778DRAFT_206522 [Xylariomycetidae sp. FL2044]|nr:hypothetical protein F4778DRAFT_206522 [Xylariomycetidae sp. FL2044]